MATNIGKPLVYGSSQTNPLYANYQGSQTYAPRSVPEQITYQGTNGQTGGVPNIGTGSTPAPAAPQYERDVNAGSDPTHLVSNGIDFGSNRAAYEAYVQQQELAPKIDEIYNPQFEHLNSVEQMYRDQLPGYNQEAQTNYDVNNQLLGTSLANTNTSINNQETSGKRAGEDAMAKARRVFMEQQIGNQQRFGGSSSAGGAMSELLARNLQSEQGQLGRQAVDLTQQVGQLRQQAQQKHDDSVLQLEQQKQKALNDIQREFQQRLSEIEGNRTQLSSAKAQMKLQALMDLRNQTFAVQQQEAQFKQALALQLAQSGSTTQLGVNSLQSLQNATTPTQGLAQGYGLQTSGGQSNANVNSQYVGAYVPNYKKLEDQANR